jgi:ATP-binding cassette subfamily F protein 3
MLTINNLTYRIGGRTILDECSVNVMDGWKVGVVGPNGAGKSTLFKLIAGLLHADGGSIRLSERQRFGMVRQDISDTDTPIIDMVLAANEEMTALFKATETETDPQKIADIYDRLLEIDAYSAPSRAAILLTGLGFREDQLNDPFNSLSGGWRMRVALAAALFVQPDVLLLDEPTNHLDLEAIMWLEGYLASYPHTLMIISHDREMLNKCVDHVIHVDKTKMTLYTGNYDTFERERAERLGQQQKMHEKQQAQRTHMQAFIDRFKAKASKARQAQSRMKALEKMDIVDAVIADRALRFDFPEPEKLPAPLIAINKVDVGYSEGNPILRKVSQNIDMDDRIALLGANGNGKSTMIKLIAGKLTPMQGEMLRSGKLRIGYFSQHQTEELDVDSTPYQEMYRLMATKNSNVKESQIRAKLGQFHFSKDLADNRIGSLSGGEKARLLFAIMSFDAPHLLLLDEPTNHLDIDAREALVQALNNFSGAVVMVSHDPSMVERVADSLWLVNDGSCRPFDGDLEDYRKFIVECRRNARRDEKARKENAVKETAAADTPPVAAPASKPTPANKRDIEKLEKEIAKLTAEKEKLENEMSQPGFYDKVDAARNTQKEYDAVIRDLAIKEEKWLNING